MIERYHCKCCDRVLDLSSGLKPDIHQHPLAEYVAKFSRFCLEVLLGVHFPPTRVKFKCKYQKAQTPTVSGIPTCKIISRNLVIISSQELVEVVRKTSS